MTLDDFILALEKTPRRWRLEGGAIRISFEPSDLPWLDFDAVDSQCPWTYVSTMNHVANVEMTEPIKALHSLFAAADNSEGHDPKLRARLLAACGLEEAR